MSLLPIIDALDALITKGAPLCDVKAAIARLRDQLEAFEKEVKELQEQKAGLEEEADNFYTQIETNPGKEQFVEHRGALFKRKPEGGYHLAVYCPRCHGSAGSFGGLPYECGKCKWFADFEKSDLANVMLELTP